ncbi:hypothetical protein LMG24235_08443 [Paraburkholderia sabiae]|nr:hypothetical protein LMG24235_08443 [Paraburkholderia sabiae]
MGGDEQGVVWQTGPNEDNTSPKALVNRTKDSYTLNPLSEMTTVHRDSLVSLVWYFRANSQQKAQFEVARAVAPGIGKPQIADAPPDQMQNLKVVQSYFSGDAKILGAITIRQLLFLLDFAGLDIPALREVTEYGTNVSEQVNEAELQSKAIQVRERASRGCRSDRAVKRSSHSERDRNCRTDERVEAASTHAPDFLAPTVCAHRPTVSRYTTVTLLRPHALLTRFSHLRFSLDEIQKSLTRHLSWQGVSGHIIKVKSGHLDKVVANADVRLFF